MEYSDDARRLNVSSVDYMASCFQGYLHAAETNLSFVHKIRTKNRNFILEACKDRLADAKRLNGLFIGSREQMFVGRSRYTGVRYSENCTKRMRKTEKHGLTSTIAASRILGRP